MKLSIITVCFNNLQGLRQTLDSVFAQTWNAYELIVIDGGSTDGTKEYLEQIGEKLSYWCSEKDAGTFDAMNKGIRHAHGDYINFMNSGDCFFAKDTLGKVFANKNYKDTVLYGECCFVKDGVIGERVAMPHDISLNFFIRHGWINHQSAFIKRNYLDQHPYRLDIGWGADWDHFLCILLDGGTFHYIEEVICAFDISGVSSNAEEGQRNKNESLLRNLHHVRFSQSILALDRWHQKSIFGRTVIKMLSFFAPNN